MYKVINPPPGGAYLHLRFPCIQIYSSPCFSSFFSGNNETVVPIGVLEYHLLFLTTCIIFRGKICQTQRIIALETFRVPFVQLPSLWHSGKRLTEQTWWQSQATWSHCHVLPTCLHASSAQLFKCGEKSGSVLTRSTGGPCGHLERPPGSPDAVRKLNWSPLMISEP